MKRPPRISLYRYELWLEPNKQYLLREADTDAPQPAPGSELLTTVHATSLWAAQLVRDAFLGHPQDPRDSY